MGTTRNFDILGHRDIAGLTLMEVYYPADYREPHHDHPNPYFQCVLKGSYTEHEANRDIDYTAFSLGFQPAGVPHISQIHQEGLHCFTIHIGPSWAERLQDHAGALRQATSYQGGLLPWLGVRLYNEFRDSDDVSPLAIEGLALEMVAEAIRCDAMSPEYPPPRWLRQVTDLLHAHFAETLTLDQIARSAGVHPVYLGRAFRQQYRCTIGDYIRRLRIEYACRELSSSSTPLAEVALAAGFTDQSHFSKVFKRVIGFSPAIFRDNYSLRSSDTKKV
jgi:AraC family transcriptional regulator